MAKLSLQLKLGQQLTMTPQLQQAIRLLQLPVIELNTQIQDALENNVMLELEDVQETDTPAAEPPVMAAEENDPSPWDAMIPSGTRSDNWTDAGAPQAEFMDHSEESLREHLLWQLEMENFSPREILAGQALIDCINNDGYLTDSVENICATLARETTFSTEEVESVLKRIQTLDPTGVGARDLADCIGIQLRQLNTAEPGRNLAIQITESSLDLVADREHSILRRQFSVSDEELDLALGLIRNAHPRPGSAIQSSTPEYVIPDVYVRKVDGRWVVDINRGGAPQLRVNQTYARMLGSSNGHSTLNSQLQEARWLVRSLEIRNETLLKVAICIIERQVEFLEHGDEAMKPMILRNVAETVEMHESTISRVTTNKYMHTPRGVFEFKHFFSSQLTATDGSEESSTAVRARIRRLIGKEDPVKPLSDSKIATLLEKEGTKVARRTVAKYREAMNIPPSSERKKKKTH
jgi:RNA polymerase sigma-54 factor